MSGLGFKDFATNEVLTASDVDGYLMSQAVMRFDDAAARGSALGTAVGTAVALAEGMMTYLDDSSRVEVYDSVGWRLVGGKLMSVTQANRTLSVTVTSATDVLLTGSEVVVTPERASSKFLLLFTANAEASGGVRDIRYRFYRDATPVFDQALDTGANTYRMMGAMSFLDEPATASAITYSIYVSASASSVSIRDYAFTVMEVAA